MTRGDTYDEARSQPRSCATPAGQRARKKPTSVVANLSGDARIAPERHPRYAEANAAYDALMLDVSARGVT